MKKVNLLVSMDSQQIIYVFSIPFKVITISFPGKGSAVSQIFDAVTVSSGQIINCITQDLSIPKKKPKKKEQASRGVAFSRSRR